MQNLKLILLLLDRHLNWGEEFPSGGPKGNRKIGFVKEGLSFAFRKGEGDGKKKGKRQIDTGY